MQLQNIKVRVSLNNLNLLFNQQKSLLNQLRAFQPFNGISKVQVEDNIYITMHKTDPSKDSEFSRLILI